MPTISFDFNKIKSYADFYSEFGFKLEPPKCFGKNLDALYDFISGEAEIPLKIDFINCNTFKQRAFSRLIAVMKILDNDVKDFHFQLRENENEE